MTEDDRLKKSFDYVRKACFPKWDYVFKWTAKLDPSLPSQGKCLTGSKSIIVKFIPDSDDELYLLLIHEICHSSAPHHGEKWVTRMLRTAKRVQKIGLLTLSNLVAEEVKLYEESERISTAETYNQIFYATLDNPKSSYEDVRNAVARDLGLYPYEFERRFKKSKKSYEEAREYFQEKAEKKAKSTKV